MCDVSSHHASATEGHEEVIKQNLSDCSVSYTQLQQTCTPYDRVQCVIHTARADLH